MTPEKNEDRYDTIDILIKSRNDGQSWFDIFFDLITENCQGTEDPNSCTCGLESMGGSSGTLEQCYDHMRVSENWATVKTKDLKLILELVINELSGISHQEAFERLRKEAYWHDEFNEWLANLPDDEEHEDEEE